jgi:Protein of unknown function (DUF4019)
VKAKGKSKKAKVKTPGAPRVFFTFAFCLFTFAFLACEVDERRQITPEQQAAIDRVTEDIAAGRDEQLYNDAAAEWRAAATPDESRANLERVRARLGRVQSRALHTGTEKDNAAGPLAGHSLVVTYQTTFERTTGMETFTLLERDGRWLLAGYTVTSDALK